MAADTTQKSTLQNIFDYTTGVGVPVFQDLVYGGDRASDADMANEQNSYDALNGSGAPDRAGFLAAAGRSTMDFLFGAAAKTNPPNTTAPTTATKSAGGLNMNAIILAAGIAIVAFFLFKKL